MWDVIIGRILTDLYNQDGGIEKVKKLSKDTMARLL